MYQWHELLARVLDKLVESAQGEDCLEFWDTVISNVRAGSGSFDHLNGWASVFCVFNSEGKWIAKDKFRGTDEYGWPFIE